MTIPPRSLFDWDDKVFDQGGDQAATGRLETY